MIHCSSDDESPTVSDQYVAEQFHMFTIFLGEHVPKLSAEQLVESLDDITETVAGGNTEERKGDADIAEEIGKISMKQVIYSPVITCCRALVKNFRARCLHNGLANMGAGQIQHAQLAARFRNGFDAAVKL